METIKSIKIKPLLKKDFSSLLEMEEKIYPKDFIQGQRLLQDIEKSNGLKYSFVAFSKEESVGYIVAVEDKTSEGEPTVYLEDIAVLPEFQGRGIAWEMLKKLVEKLKSKAKKENKNILWNMHLRETSQGLFEKHKIDLENMGVKFVKEIVIPGHYRNGENALFVVYDIK